VAEQGKVDLLHCLLGAPSVAEQEVRQPDKLDAVRTEEAGQRVLPVLLPEGVLCE